VRETVNNRRDGIAYFLADTLAGRIPATEVLQLLQADGAFQPLEQPDVFLEALNRVGWHNVRLALICQQQNCGGTGSDD